MQPVAPDPIVSRPLRPEPAPARRNEQPGAFDAMLDARPADTPRPPRAERPARAERRSDAAPKEQTQSRAERTPDAEPQDTAEPAKPADAPNTRQAKNGQPSHGQPSEPTTKASAEGDLAQTEAAAELAVALDAALPGVAVEISEAKGDAATAPLDETATPAVPTEAAAKDGGDAPAPVVDAKPAEIAPPVVVAVAVPAPAAPAAVIEPAADAVIAPVASAPAPAAPAAPAPADPAAAPAPAAPVAAPADGKDKTAKSVPQQADADIEATSDAPKPAKDLPTAEPKQPEQKAEADKPKADQHGPIKHAAPEAHAPVNNRPAVADAPAEAPKAARQPHAQSAEAAAPRAVSSETRPDTPAPQAATPSPSVPANAPIMPFGLALSSSLTATLPHAALRVDTPDVPVPLAGVAVEIVARAQDGLKRFDIRLDPPELGRIDVRLDVDHGGKVTSRLIVERAETLDLLRRDAPQLERALQQAGLNTEGGMQFSLRDQTFAGRDQTRDSANTSHLVIPEDDTAAADAARRGYGRLIGLGGGIDIRV